ncbi:MAG: class I SAM-dependent methyltransferase [Candidatus Zixiibacteriota bacterium]|nr:MAG: class I SAM-dependent methyltransferase [candidate division Zixibacteria bacterium]
MPFTNSYDDRTRAEAYAVLEFANTYHLAFRDIPELIRKHVAGTRALDFGCGTGRSTRFLRQLGLEAAGVDVSEDMLAKARGTDPQGRYLLVPGDDLGAFPPGRFDLILSAFTFDNIPQGDKVRIFRDLAALLAPGGKFIHLVSAPEIYTHEWTTFSTKDFPENRLARSGDMVRIITTDYPDPRPVEDILCTDESYREIFRASGLEVVEMLQPLATGEEPYTWVNETRVAPWTIYLLQRAE